MVLCNKDLKTLEELRDLSDSQLYDLWVDFHESHHNHNYMNGEPYLKMQVNLNRVIVERWRLRTERKKHEAEHEYSSYSKIVLSCLHEARSLSRNARRRIRKVRARIENEECDEKTIEEVRASVSDFQKAISEMQYTERYIARWIEATRQKDE